MHANDALLLYPTEIALEHHVRKKWLAKSNTAAEVVIGKISLLRAECSYPEPGLNSPPLSRPLLSNTVVNTLSFSFTHTPKYTIIKGLAIDCMRIHPQHLELSAQGFSCLKDLERDAKMALSHAGACCLIHISYLHFCNSFSPGKPLLPIFCCPSLLLCTVTPKFR